MSDILTIMKKHCVAISHDSGNGSGVLIQGMSEQYSYVLTAKHVLQIAKDDESQGFIDKQKIKIKDTGDNALVIQELYHDPSLDISIIKINFYPLLEISPYKEDIERETEVFLYGCPRGFPPETYTLKFLDKGQETIEFSVNEHVQVNEMDGFSGGGMFYINDGKVYLYGVDNSAFKQADFVNRPHGLHISAFEQIIENNNLARLMPLYLSNFSHLTGDTFSTVCTEVESNLIEIIAILHKNISNKISNSVLSPIKILDDFQDRLIAYRQKHIELEEKQLWVAFLEFVVVQLIINAPDHFNDGWEVAYLNKIFHSYRFIYTNSAKSYKSLYRKLIVTSNTSHLKTNGKIILVASGHMPSEPDSITHKIKGTLSDISIGLSDSGIANVQKNRSKEYPIIHWSKLNDKCLADREFEYKKLNRIEHENEMIEMLKQDYETYLKIKDD